MMKEIIKIKESKNKFIFTDEKIENCKGDVIVLWSNANFLGGTDSFYLIRRKAGAQLERAIIFFSGRVKSGDVISTIPGMLDFYIVCHAIIPTMDGLYNDVVFNLFQTIKTFKKNNICRNVHIPFDLKNKSALIENILKYEKSLIDFSYFFHSTEENYKENLNIYNATISKFIKRNKRKRLS